MMNHEMEIPHDVQALLDQLLDGTISDEGRSILDQSLRANPLFQDYFLDYCQLHIDLAIDLRADQALESFRDRQRRIVPLTAPVVNVDDGGPLPSQTGASLFGFSGVGFSGFATFGIALCVLMLAAVGGLWWWSGFREEVNRAPLASANWVEADTPSITSVQLGSGTTKLELANIGSVVVEGPADFKLIGPMRARLNHGRIKVHVSEPSGRGFVVETPDGEVTDLGTEFGLDVAEQLSTGLVVFQGTVDLRVGETEQISGASPVNRLFGGDGVRFSKSGQLDRIMSVVTSSDGTFRLLTGAEQNSSAVITHVSDNIRTADMNKFYEIVRGGMREDARAYVDRQEHEWNGLTEQGMPEYLIGADYVKPFNNDKVRKNLDIEVTLSGPARLFVIWDDRLPPPEWLKRDFQRFGDRIGLDMGNSFTENGRPITQKPREVGPGKSIDQSFSIWEREVTQAGKVKLGATEADSNASAMYGIAAARLQTKMADQNTETNSRRRYVGLRSSANRNIVRLLSVQFCCFRFEPSVRSTPHELQFPFTRPAA